GGGGEVGLGWRDEPGEWAPRSGANETLRCWGTNTLLHSTVFEPLARRPAQYQVSSSFSSDVGTRNRRMSGWSSPGRKTRPPIMIHCEWRMPLHHDHWPLRR